MVLQRGKPVCIWGESDAPVTVMYRGVSATAVPDAAGRFRAELPPLEACEGANLIINEVVLRNVAVGDVFLCAGQSNMELSFARMAHRYPEEMANPCPHIRELLVPTDTQFKVPRRTLSGAKWKVAAPDTIDTFSGVAYFFAKRIYERERVPIGIIVSAVGGSRVCAWMNRESVEGLTSQPEMSERLKEIDSSAFNLSEKMSYVNDARTAFDKAVRDIDIGVTGQWHMPEYDDSDWETAQLLNPWDGAGSMWFRKTIDIPDDLVGTKAALFMGAMLDADFAYANGRMLGGTTYRFPPREYEIAELPKSLTLAIRVISDSPKGGRFIPGKQYLLYTKRGAINLNTEWKCRRGAAIDPISYGYRVYFEPTGLYNAMIAPLVGYAIKGMIWYQGESDDQCPGGYADRFRAMLAGWRRDWGEIFPAAFVELVHYLESDWDTLRTEQWDSLSAPNTAMAAAFELGEHNDLHPQGKQAVGDRLARCMTMLAYGGKITPSPFEIIALR